jgi:6-phosphogluconolactonase
LGKILMVKAERYDMARPPVKYRMYVGTYTEGNSKGIYVTEYDHVTGMTGGFTVAADAVNPTYLDINGDILYCALEINEAGGMPGGAVAAYRIDKDNKELVLLGQRQTGGKDTCHVSTDRDGSYLFAANYTDGSVSVFPINTDGGIAPRSSFVKHDGSGTFTGRQEHAHAHYVSLTPDGRYLLAADLGADKVFAYAFDGDNGTLISSDDMTVSVRPGSGPRHFIFSSDAAYMYVLTELSSEVLVFEYTPDNDRFVQIQNITTLPHSYTGWNSCAAIHMSLDGSYLYASNRGHDSIISYAVDKRTGKLRTVSVTPSGGCHPRDFAIDPCGRYMFVANTYSSFIVRFIMDTETGMIEHTGDIIEVPSPACIKFVGPVY